MDLNQNVFPRRTIIASPKLIKSMYGLKCFSSPLFHSWCSSFTNIENLFHTTIEGYLLDDSLNSCRVDFYARVSNFPAGNVTTLTPDYTLIGHETVLHLELNDLSRKSIFFLQRTNPVQVLNTRRRRSKCFGDNLNAFQTIYFYYNPFLPETLQWKIARLQTGVGESVDTLSTHYS